MELKLNFAPFALARGSLASDIQVSSQTAGTGGSWYAEKFVFGEDTTINRLGYVLGLSSSNPSFIVGITTSYGPHGLFPATRDGVAGSAGSLAFSTSVFVSGTAQSNNLRALSLPSDFICLKDVSYWLAWQIISAASGTRSFWWTSSNHFMNRRSEAIVSNFVGVAGFGSIDTTRIGKNIVVPGYYSGSGVTQWYPKGHYLGDDSILSGTPTLNYFYHKLPGVTTYEFGGRFELNELGVQEIELQYIQWANVHPVDSNIDYTCRLYDYRHNIVGTAITERAIFASAAAADRGTMTFYFVPKIKLRTDFPYYLGLSASGGTACSAFHRVVSQSGGDTMRSQSVHYLDYVQRTSFSSDFSEDQILIPGQVQKSLPGISLGITDFIPMRRNNGN